MKTLLLSMAAVAVASLTAYAEDYEFLVGTQVENKAVTDFVPAQDGAEYVVHPHVQVVNEMISQVDCDIYPKAINNTDAPIQVVVNATLVQDNSVLPAGCFFQTCFGGQCVSVPITTTLQAQASTPGTPGEHFGYSYTAFGSSDPLGDLQLDAKYNITVDMGNGAKTLSFVVHYLSEAAGISGIEATDAKAVYYNMQGMRVNEPVKGELYIVRQGSKTFKTFAR